MVGPSPLRGADAVNDESEVGYDQAFERRWRIAELVGRVAMVLFACQRGIMRLKLVRYAVAERDGKFSIVQESEG